MKNIKKTIAAIMMTGIILLGTTFANAGIIVIGAKEDTSKTTKTTTQGCTESTGKVNAGIIVLGLTGIIVIGFTGIIVIGAKESTAINCGIIVIG